MLERDVAIVVGERRDIVRCCGGKPVYLVLRGLKNLTVHAERQLGVKSAVDAHTASNRACLCGSRRTDP